MSKNLANRTPQQVFEDHLKLANEGKVEEDIKRNCAEDIVLLTNWGTFRGHSGVREAAKLLDDQLNGGSYNYKLIQCEDKMCFLTWTAESETVSIPDGADSFLIENGKIKVQTIYYSVQEKS
ncbi:nuclear transport factor 2-like protein [Halocola ammonii]